jgi:hypothetical protein
MPVLPVVSFLVIMMMVSGPLLTGSGAASSAYHAHIFLVGADADQLPVGKTFNHEHDAHGAEVLSVFDHSGGSSQGPLHLIGANEPYLPASLATSIQWQMTEVLRTDALVQPPEQPPRAA